MLTLKASKGVATEAGLADFGALGWVGMKGLLLERAKINDPCEANVPSPDGSTPRSVIMMFAS
jgi:hypothetical protein